MAWASYAKSFYFDQDDRSKEIRAKYLVHVANMFVLAGIPPAQAKSDASAVFAIESDLAKSMMDAVDRRDPKNTNNPMALAQFTALASSFDWDTYLRLVNSPSVSRVNVVTPAFFKSLDAILAAHSLDDWKSYFRWHLLHGNATALSEAFVNEDFDFYEKTLDGVEQIEPRWRRCVRGIDHYLGDALGQAYVQQAFPPENKAKVLVMVKDIESSLSAQITAATWMSPATKQQAQTKLAAVLNKIGYPDKWRDYSSLSIVPDNYLLDRQNAVTFEYHRDVHKIGQPVDRSEWIMTPPTNNAYEDPQSNTINFPAGILQPPNFELSQDAAVNYGAIGATIGHELIHGFDDQGRKFDAKGNLRDWWTPQDAAEYQSRGKCISDQYTQPVPEAGPGVNQNGLMTLGEDTADIGGLHLALMALESDLKREGKSLDQKDSTGFTALQRFFLSYAFSWAESARPDMIRTEVLTDSHSYPVYRVNNVVSNFPEFSKAFSCHEGQKMSRPHYCRIW